MRGFLVFLFVRTIVTVNGFNLDWVHPEIIDGGMERGSYFGFSVGLLENSQGLWVLAAAPKANPDGSDPNDINAGAIYKCTIHSKICEEIPFHTKVPSVGYHPELGYDEFRRDSFLGISLDIANNSMPNVLACAHLWKNKDYPEMMFANGICYTIDSELNLNTVRELLPLVDIRKQVKKGGVLNYALGMAGFSSQFIMNTNDVILGAPGVKLFTGSIIFSSKRDYNLPRYRQQFHIPEPAMEYNSFSYLGYSVASGDFLGDGTVEFALGAPRANLTGKVYLVKQDRDLRPRMILSGQQMGEYFGSSVCAVDFNGDGLTDLLVGAPMYSVAMDEGIVYAYTNNNKRLSISPIELKGTKTIRARFGTAITNLGDLDQDDFQDVAIGAPYEDAGVVYIYSGSKSGLVLTQRIRAKEINSNLRGFGFSISKGKDIDGNKYADLAIGAYESDQIVVLKSYPVVSLHLSLAFNETVISNDVSCRFQNNKTFCFTITACISFGGTNMPLYLVVKSSLKVGLPSEEDRRSILVTPVGSRSDITEERTISSRTQRCTNYTAHVLPEVDDVVTPVHFTLSAELLNPLRESKFCDHSCAVNRPGENNLLSKSISFSSHFDSTTDLRVMLILQQTSMQYPMLFGPITQVTLDVLVENLGPDPAYSPKVNIVFPNQISVIDSDTCGKPTQKSSNQTMIDCNIQSPINLYQTVALKLKVDLSELKISLESLEIAANVTSASKDNDTSNNIFKLKFIFAMLLRNAE